jgi:23S rRNA (uracil1939-C5)-methyltransferase
MNLTSGQILELEVEKLAFGGEGIARYNGFTIFLDHAVPGQKVKAELTEVKKRFAKATSIEVTEHAEIEAQPFCKHFNKCGGCQHQDMDYRSQLYWKGRQTAETLSRIGKVESEITDQCGDALASPQTESYRNKMEFFISGQGENLVVGLKRKGSDTDVLDIDYCPLFGAESENIIKTVRKFCADSKIPSFSDSKTGYWRRLVIRKSVTSGKMLVHLITGPGKKFHEESSRLGDILIEQGEVTAFAHSTRKAKTDIAEGEWIVDVKGDDHIIEKLSRNDGSSVQYAITPNAFFQTNTEGAEILFSTVAEQLKLDRSETVVDLYCGSGGIGLFIADKVKNVFGIELSEEAVLMGTDNAKSNSIGNCMFRCANLEKGKSVLAGIPEMDVIIMDPPRRGVSKTTLNEVSTAGAEKIIYVSCNPATLARDAALLKGKYEVTKIVPVDMFPHTQHIECVCVFSKSA